LPLTAHKSSAGSRYQKPASALDDAQLVDRHATFQTFGFVSDANAADALIDPEGIAADATGHIYVVDARRNQVNLYTWNAMSRTMSMIPILLPQHETALPALAFSLPAISQSARTARSIFWIRVVSASCEPTIVRHKLGGISTDTSLANPYGLDVGPDGRVYIADTDNHRIVRYNATGGGSVSFGRYGTGPEQFRYPRDVGVDIDGGCM